MQFLLTWLVQSSHISNLHGRCSECFFGYCDVDVAAITDAALCTNVGGVWKQPKCSVASQLACTQHGGQWQSAEQWTLKGGVDLLIVGLLQVKLHHPCPYVCSAICEG